MKKKPNVIFTITDDQGVQAVESETSHDTKTPNLKRLAESEVIFDKLYCTSPACPPTRASIITGKVPSCHGIQDWLRKGNLDIWKYPHTAMVDGFGMEDKSIDYLKDHKTYMEYLAESGYHCALSERRYMGDNITKKKGFEYHSAIGRGGRYYCDVDIFENEELFISYECIADTIINHVLGYLDRLSGEGAPFHLDIHCTVPHSPWNASEHPKKLRGLYKDYEFKDIQALPVHPWQANNTCPIGDTPGKRREYLAGCYAAISATDVGVGKTMNWVAAHRLEEGTVLTFTSDDGMNLGQYGIWGKGNGTYPPDMYGSSVKVPLIIKVPECEAPRSTCSATAGQYDIPPTILSLTGCKYELESLQPGKSLLERVNHPAEKYESWIVISDEYSKTHMIKKGSLKHIYRYENSPCESYDLPRDPDEETNFFGNPGFEKQIRSLEVEPEGWFDRYSVPKTDTRICGAVGRGREKMCYEKNAFGQSIELYHHS